MGVRRRKKRPEAALEQDAAISRPAGNAVADSSSINPVLLLERQGKARLDGMTGLEYLRAHQLRELIDAQAKLCEINIWDRMPYENNKHASYFAMYRDLGINRELNYLINEAATFETLKVWKFRFQWDYRLEAYDAWKLEHRSRDLEFMREEIITKKHGNLLRLDELNGQLLTDPEAFTKNKKVIEQLGITDNLATFKQANELHKTLFGEKKMVLKQTRIDFNLSDEYADVQDI